MLTFDTIVARYIFFCQTQKGHLFSGLVLNPLNLRVVPSLKCQSDVLLWAQSVTYLFACKLFSEWDFFVETTNDSSDGCLLEQSIVLMLLISYGYKLSEILTYLWLLHVCAVIAGPSSLCLQMWHYHTKTNDVRLTCPAKICPDSSNYK